MEKEIKQENSTFSSSSEFDWMNSNNFDEVSLPDSIEFGLPDYASETHPPKHKIPIDSVQSNSKNNQEDVKPSPPDAPIVKNNKSTKRRGPRTTIKQHQLDALMAAFELSTKPAKSIRESLAKETGLELRVIQVKAFLLF